MKWQRWMWSLAPFGGLCSLLVAGPSAVQAQEQGETEERIVEVQLQEPGVGDRPMQADEPADEPFFRERRPTGIPEAVFETDRPDPNRPRTMTPIGLSLTAGGGVTDFSGANARRSTDIGGNWNARLNIGTRTIVGAEIAYVGSSQGVDAVGLDPDANLLGNGAEAAARLNFLSGMWQPYVLAGVGWMNYQIINADFNTSALQDSDNLITFPLSAGLAFRYRGLVLDARGTFRPVIEDDLFPGNMHTWGAQLNGGFEF